MRYKLLGKSGLRVSELCLGTMTFGEELGFGANGDESRAIYDAFREAGENFVDTANIYTNGTSESMLGEFMQGHRDSVVCQPNFPIFDWLSHQRLCKCLCCRKKNAKPESLRKLSPSPKS